jgi:selenocysteine lyase/cysteine desulfurase
MDAAIQYLEQLGYGPSSEPQAENGSERRSHLVRGMTAIRAYEESLSREFLRVLAENRATVYGIADERRIRERVPTFCFNLAGISPAAVTQGCSDAGIGIRDGHMYAPRLMQRLGLPQDSGVVRASLVHYNTFDEIRCFGDVLRSLTRHV